MAEDNNDQEKTEEPTAKKLSDARKRGQVAMSKEVNNWILLFGVLVLITLILPFVFKDIGTTLTHFIANANDINMSPGGLGDMMGWLFMKVGLVIIIPIGLIMVMGLLASIIQTGFVFSAESMRPDISKLSPVKGLQRMFSMRQFIEFLLGLVKIIVVGAIGLVIFLPELQRLDILPSMSLAQLLGEVSWLIIKMLIAILIILAILAIADVMFQNYDHVKKLRMTKQEVKDEYKQTEGNPEVKARIIKIRNERQRANIDAAMKKATVVITNPTHYAVAIFYEVNVVQAPVILAKGQDHNALHMRKLAEKYDVPIVPDPPLARTLYDIGEVDQEIPEELFAAVSSIIRYVYDLRR